MSSFCVFQAERQTALFFFAISEVCVVGMAHMDGIARRYTDAKWKVIGSCESLECHVRWSVPKPSSKIKLSRNSVPMLQHILPRKTRNFGKTSFRSCPLDSAPPTFSTRPGIHDSADQTTAGNNDQAAAATTTRQQKPLQPQHAATSTSRRTP